MKKTAYFPQSHNRLTAGDDPVLPPANVATRPRLRRPSPIPPPCLERCRPSSTTPPPCYNACGLTPRHRPVMAPCSRTLPSSMTPSSGRRCHARCEDTAPLHLRPTPGSLYPPLCINYIYIDPASRFLHVSCKLEFFL
jgi:hypothetical protein